MNYIDITTEVCMGCGLCQVFCVTSHSQSKDTIKAFKREIPRQQPRNRIEQNSDISFAIQCRNCNEPPCVYACLTGAMSIDAEIGKVIHAADKCIGCWTCIMVCPYGAIVRDKDRHLISKCDLCAEHEIPACVANCPNEAIKLISAQTTHQSQPTG